MGNEPRLNRSLCKKCVVKHRVCSIRTFQRMWRHKECMCFADTEGITVPIDSEPPEGCPYLLEYTLIEYQPKDIHTKLSESLELLHDKIVKTVLWFV